ncbi:insulinase family protein [Deinococcus multiflagellatus]|uniref:insulinase family protein n=1 Tax=Deinococcus multiflagellatus TaxID=1656887 RepID=UPI001CCC2C70|nr:insulinase family protein [Deinococcus multiflagellatus]MBZ9715192.1 insulinase family protein [Deinococcus multiflagellatus]
MTATLPAAPRVGERLGRYTVQRVEALPEMQGTLVLLTHELGARHAHVIRADDNATFGVTFPTVPQDSTGVAHILEHVALMGSQRYPVSDPFFSMLPRSLNTFMNAMTASDWTTYPFSTRNEKDFFNLLSVYLDAAFFPLMRYESFRQDGHRLEFETPDDPSTPLKLQGVVYNEMKGAMASPGSVLWRAFGKALYPDLTYANNSGGAPGDIPNLTYDALRAFHAAHYHPSNAFFYTYGQLPLERILQEIETQVMARFSPQMLDVRIPDQPAFDAPRRETVTYPGTDTERGAQVVVAWKLGLSSDPHQNLRWSVLSDVLLGNAGAPLTRPLIESGLGGALSDLSGYRDNFREGAFGAGLKGLPAGQAQAVETLVLDTLGAIARDGLDPELIQSSLHQFEIMQKEVSNAGQPYGLQVMFRLLGPWLHGGDPVTGLRLDDALNALRADLARGAVFEPMLKGLLANPHRVTLELAPDPGLAAQVEADEQALIARLSANFTDEDRARIVAESARLKEVQAQPSDPGVLPTLTLADVPAAVPAAPYTTEQNGGVTVARAPQPTGGLSYLDLRLRLPELPDDLLSVLPLYTFAVTRSGAAGQDYAALARRLEAVTGGVSASVGVGNAPDDLGRVRLAVTFSGKALARNAPALVTVLRDLLAAPEFTRERLDQLLKQRLAGLKSSVVSSGNFYAERLAEAQLSPAGALQERLSGLSALATLKGIVEGDRVDELLSQFARLQALIRQGEPLLLLTATEADLALDLSELTAALPGGAAGQPTPALAPRTPQARTTDTPVSYNAAAWPTVPYTHADSPALLVLSRLLRAEYLLPELREKGGAYSGAASFEPRTGLFAMSSYRDPHLARTFGVFREARAFLAGVHEERTLTEAILSASKLLDPLTSPDTAGQLRVFSDHAGYTPEVQAAYKARLLAVTLDDLRRVAETWLTPERAAYGVVTGRDPNGQDGVAELGLRFEVAEV